MYDGLRNLEVPRRSRSRRPRRALRTIGILSLVMVIFGGAGLAYTYWRVQENLDRARAVLPELDQHLPGQALNILILGSDNRNVIRGKERSRREFQGDVGQRADVIILLHLAPRAERAVLVSLPRDLLVEIPGYGQDKLNSAYALGAQSGKRNGGPRLTIRTVQRFTGLDIHHYVEINYASFRDIVDAIGGVNIYIDRPLQDPRSGLNIPEPGCIKMNGEVALSYVRARYIDPTADIGRMQRQQEFIRVVLRKIKSASFVLNPTKWIALSEAVGDGLTIDEEIGLSTGRAVASQLSANEESVDFRIVPSYSDLINGISYLVPYQDQMNELFDAINKDRELPDYGKTSASAPEPEDVSVEILNASGKSGLAGREQRRLGKKGFVIEGVGNASSQVSQTIVEYEFGDQLKAKLVARYFPDAKTRLVDEVNGDVSVLVGTEQAYRVAMIEWEAAKRRAERRGEPAPPEPTPPAPTGTASASPKPSKVDPEKRRCA